MPKQNMEKRLEKLENTKKAEDIHIFVCERSSLAGISSLRQSVLKVAGHQAPRHPQGKQGGSDKANPND